MPAPEPLLRVCDNLKHPAVMECGLTKTQSNQWALWVKVRRGTEVPVAEIDAMAEGFPIVYEVDEASELPVARPAFPARGE